MISLFNLQYQLIKIKKYYILRDIYGPKDIMDNEDYCHNIRMIYVC